MQILITGAGGMLGSDLFRVLQNNHDVVGVGRNPALHLTGDYRVCDLAVDSEFNQLFNSKKSDLVIHSAAYTQVDLCEAEKEEALKINFTLTKNITDLCATQNIPLLFFSTDYVFQGDKEGPYLETDPVDPINYYGYTKERAEDYILNHAYRAMIWRVTWLFGKHGKHFPGAIENQIKKGNKNLQVVNDQWGRPTYTSDIADAVSRLISVDTQVFETYNRHIFHIGNAEAANWADVAREITQVLGADDVSVTDIPSTDLNRAARRPLNSVLCLDKAKKELGLELRSWKHALKAYFETREKDV